MVVGGGVRGTSGSDWVLPGSRGAATDSEAGAGAAEALFARPPGAVSGSTAAAAHATPIDDAMNARINPILDTRDMAV
ncbi:hypothetical protein GCM10023079_14840 [Streptomyces chitinivorans]